MSNRRSGLRAKPVQSVAKIYEKEKPRALPVRKSRPYLPALGIYGFGEIEPVILAALVTGDPLLLIGASGTGKTYLLNSLSEALNLQHRHYNASLISFDDLVGFPYPGPEGTGVRFLETPATVWGAESVLIDEISRSKTARTLGAIFRPSLVQRC
jgi:MoxR-like ATPase